MRNLIKNGNKNLQRKFYLRPRIQGELLRMEIKKLISILILSFYFIASSFAVQVVKQTQITQEPENEGLRAIVLFIFGGGAIILFIGAIIFLLAWIMYKIYTKIQEYNRKKRDFLYYDFEHNATYCHVNRDTLMKHKRLRTFWIFWKRSNVYAKTKNGLEFLGYYNGEAQKKENYYMVSLYNKLGFFKYQESIIFIPSHMKNDLINKIDTDGKRSMIIYCEGVDSIENTDYYYIPLIYDPKDPNKFIDFSDMIHKDYVEKTVYKDVIKEDLLSFRENIIRSVEANPNVHISRRVEK